MEILKLTSSNDIEEYWKLVKGLGDLYDECFDDGDEKERFYSVILERVKDIGTFDPRTELHIAHEDGKTVGGAIYDVYWEPAGGTTVHLIYLMVAEDHRRKNIGSELLDYGKERFKDQPIFIEIDKDWTDETPGHGGVNALQRSLFYKKNYMHVVLWDSYIQPPLEKGGEWCDKLMLCAIGRRPSKKEAYRFLVDLYKSLGVLGTYEGDNMLNLMRWRLNVYQPQPS